MANYIYQLIAFIAAIIMYTRGDYKVMAVWLAACVIFGFNGVIADYIYRKFKEDKNGTI